MSRLDESLMPFGISVKVETLYVLLLLARGLCNQMRVMDVLTTSRTFSGDASIMIDVWSVVLNQDMMDEVLFPVYDETG